MTLVDKIKAAALEAIDRQEGIIGTVVWWELTGTVRHHTFMASVEVRTDSSAEPFTIWVTVDLDTEKTVAV